jgi:hypothetical protein
MFLRNDGLSAASRSLSSQLGKSLIERFGGRAPTLADRGRAVLGAMPPDLRSFYRRSIFAFNLSISINTACKFERPSFILSNRRKNSFRSGPFGRTLGNALQLVLQAQTAVFQFRYPN